MKTEAIHELPGLTAVFAILAISAGIVGAGDRTKGHIEYAKKLGKDVTEKVSEKDQKRSK